MRGGAASRAGPARRPVTGRRFLADVTGAACLVIGGVLLALFAGAAPPLSGLARQNLNASGGSVPVWVSAGVRGGGPGAGLAETSQPAQAGSWSAVAFFFAVSEDASYYTVAAYGLRHGDLPLSGLALLVQPGWAPGIVLLGLVVLVFPDGRRCRRRGGGGWCSPTRWWPALWMTGAVVLTVRALADHRTQVERTSGNLLLLSGHDPAAGWWGTCCRTPVLPSAGRLLARLDRQPGARYRRSSGDTAPAAEVAAGRVGRSAFVGLGLAAAHQECPAGVALAGMVISKIARAAG